jgi:thiol-disulfide isomerase/thioredoxin
MRKFSLVGKINLDSGLIKLFPLDGDGSCYYPINTEFEAKIQNGKFTITGKIPYTLAYQFFVKVNSKLIDISDIIYLDSGEQYVNYDINNFRSLQPVLNKTMSEFSNQFLPIKVDNMDSALLNYSKSFPDSYVALWQLVYSLDKDGYNSIKEAIYNNLSEQIKKTYTGLKIGEKLKSSRVVAIGNSFPILSLYNSALNETRFSIEKNYKHKIVLIDFWFSHCNPCISQFSELKRIYEAYHSKGFEIIGISVDDKPLIDDWKNVIRNYQLPWIQYLDLKGVEAKKLSVAIYPTNFLIDQQGKIISKKINLKDLENYLKDSFK